MIVEFNEEFYCKVSASAFIDIGCKWMDINVDLYRRGLTLDYEVQIQNFEGRVCEPFIFKSRYQKKIDKLIIKKVNKAKRYMNKYIQNREVKDKINNDNKTLFN